MGLFFLGFFFCVLGGCFFFFGGLFLAVGWFFLGCPPSVRFAALGLRVFVLSSSVLSPFYYARQLFALQRPGLVFTPLLSKEPFLSRDPDSPTGDS